MIGHKGHHVPLGYMLVLVIVFALSWVPGALEFSFNLHFRGRLGVGKILDILFFLPFVLSVIGGYVYNRQVLLPVTVAAIVGACAEGAATVYDMNTVDGGWAVYGSTSASVIMAAVLIGGSLLAWFVGPMLARTRVSQWLGQFRGPGING